MYQVIQNGYLSTQHDDGEQTEQICRHPLKCLSQATVIGLMVLSSMEVLADSICLVPLMALTDISWASILAIFFLAITVNVLWVTLWGVSKTRKDTTPWLFSFPKTPPIPSPFPPREKGEKILLPTLSFLWGQESMERKKSYSRKMSFYLDIGIIKK